MNVYLSDFNIMQVIESLPHHHKFDGDIAKKGYAHFVKLDLRYNTDRGFTYDNELGLKASFVNKRDIPPYTGRDDLDLLVDAFMPDINNYISCVKRGFDYE